jgi:hypothetical protein
MSEMADCRLLEGDDGNGNVDVNLGLEEEDEDDGNVGKKAMIDDDAEIGLLRLSFCWRRILIN